MSEEINFDDLKVNGSKINYFLICQRKLWLFDKKITMEYTSDKVLSGKILHENSYNDAKSKEVLIDNLISIDIVDQFNIREVKSSDKMADADRIQILYYLFYLKKIGIERKGIINYPKQRKRDFVELTPDDEIMVIDILQKIKLLLSQQKPPPVIDKPYCKKCAYFEFCYT